MILIIIKEFFGKLSAEIIDILEKEDFKDSDLNDIIKEYFDNESLNIIELNIDHGTTIKENNNNI